ncbi:MAG: GHKL domain-containing protein [Eubacterium sp.]
MKELKLKKESEKKQESRLLMEQMVREKKELNLKNQLLERLLEQQIGYYERIEQMHQELRVFRHDMKNHYLCIDALLRGKNYDKASEYLESMTNTFINETADQSNMVTTGNPIFDVLMTEKIKQAMDKNIFVSKKFQIKEKLNVSNVDWCIIIGNSMDNAIEACEYLKESERWINIQIMTKGNILNCSITNATDGNLVKNESFYETRKQNTNNHGLGLKNIASIVEKYKGVLEVNHENKIFSLVFLLCGV